jgi:hypothetical protein
MPEVHAKSSGPSTPAQMDADVQVAHLPHFFTGVLGELSSRSAE